jgi:hypothetical protein
MKIILITAALGAVFIAPAIAQPASQTQTQMQTRQDWASRVRVYAPDYYVPHYGNSNTSPDFQLGGDKR